MNFENVCLLGDFNSRCGELPDTLPKNEYSDASVDVIEFDKGNRISKDKLTNTMGYELLRFCKTCLNPSTRPNIKFDKKGNCYVCVYESLKKSDFKVNSWGLRICKCEILIFF